MLGNELTGRIPPELGRLSNLWGLSVSDNELTGPIPPELGNLANLTQLSVSRNGLTGPIPIELTALSKLEKLWLYLNDLSGEVPPGLGELTALDLLSLAHNRLSGTLPSGFSRLTRLEYLNVTANGALSGALPSEFAGLERLETLLARGTGLCAPADAGFQDWLRGLEDAQVALCRDMAGSRAYLTQTVQSLEFPVPLVAGKPALLRVFLTAARASDAEIPAVRATFHVDGVHAFQADIPAQSVPIPTAIDEGRIGASANAPIPGEVIRPGLEMVLHIDPEGTLDPGLGVPTRIPDTGWMAIDVREMPTLDLTVIPFLLQDNPDRSILDVTNGLTDEDDLLRDARTLLPVGALDVTVHEAVWTSSENTSDLLRETRMIRTMEGGSGHYLGTMPGPFSDRFSGRAYIGGRVSFAIPDSAVIAHELGHNMSLRHAPCGDPARVDQAFPNPHGITGAWGYDFEHRSLRSSASYDLMSYCHPQWIGDYGFTKALRYRLEDEAAAAGAADRVAPTTSLLLWGGADAGGTPFLEPAFVVEAPPRLPGRDGAGGAGGPYEVRGTASDGEELFSIRFDMWPIADGDGESGFVMAIPAEPGWVERLAEIRFTGPEGSAVLDADTEKPMAILRDPESGHVRGVLRDVLGGGPRGVPPPTPARRALASPVAEPGLRSLEVLFSRGLPERPAGGRRQTSR